MPDRILKPTLPLPDIPDLDAELSRLAELIPAGSIATFGDLANALGSRHAAVWVSRWAALLSPSDNPARERIVGLKNAGTQTRVQTFDRPPLLAPLRDWLRQASAHVHDRPLPSPPRYVAGIDLAYPTPNRAVAIGLTIDRESRAVVNEAVIEHPVSFPYITGFLAFRELPAMIAAFNALAHARQPPDVVMIDGQGRLHPERGGIATAFAAATGIPTIGIAKSLLCGKIDMTESPRGPHAVRPVLDREELLGFALHTDGALAPIYISVGGWITLPEALDITLGFMEKTRLPIPTHLADARSKKEARMTTPERRG